MAQAGTTSDWNSPKLAQYATGDALSAISRGMYADHLNGLVTKGAPKNDPKVTSATPAANPADEQLVNLPTWLWLERGDRGAVSATASVPGVSVTSVARPTSVVWTMGDGKSVTCPGPGTPYGSRTSPKSPSPDCGYTYRISSAGRPDSAYAVSATVHWTVTWAGAGQGGVFPDMTTTSNADFRVAESQALNNGG